jgi:protein-S-isoprenylcysteine O-methyltransferase Ste14
MNPALAAGLVVLATAAYGALHSWLASHSAKRLGCRLFGISADRFYRLAFNIVGAATLLPLLAFVALHPGRVLYRLPPPYSWLCLAGQAVAVGAVVLGLLETDPWHFLGIRQLLEPAGRASPLTTNGLYRYVRHPLYTAGFVFLWLTPVMTSTLFALYLGLSLYLYIGSLFEERRLLAEFGSPYRDYQQAVPRLIPLRRRRPNPSPPPGASG